MHIFYENHGCLTIFQNQTCINIQYTLVQALFFAPAAVGTERCQESGSTK